MFFRANITSTLEISAFFFLLNMRSLGSVSCYMANVQL